MPDFRRFIASSDIFSGYEVLLDIDIHNSLDNIVNIFYDNLHNILHQYKFEILVEKIKQCRFHIHDFTYEDIKNSNPENIIYICDHC
jgi:hypothetical protein